MRDGRDARNDMEADMCTKLDKDEWKAMKIIYYFL